MARATGVTGVTGVAGGAGGPAPPATGGRRAALVLGVGTVLLAVAFVVALGVGSVGIPPGDTLRILTGGGSDHPGWEAIVLDIRLPRSITAVACGAALGVAGLQMQTLFRNPLADPFVLGISSGAGLGVALVVLAAGSGDSVFAAGLGPVGDLSLAAAAVAGAGVVLVVVLAVARRVESSVTVLVIGLMVSYAVSAVVTVLVAAASPERVQQYLLWGFGSFRAVTWDELRVLAPVVVLGVLAACATLKPLNALLLGERYAASLGVDVRRTRAVTIVVASTLAGVVTAFAGPLAFLGVAVPHLARMATGTSDHRVLLPTVLLGGGIVALVAEVVAQVPGQNGILPLNAVTSILGAPVVVAVILRSRRASSALAR